ncbi:MAG: hypothetical protein EOP04_33610 [Proteobacteria bacterium]|nr:MAG: hypothetical protein EOP04_33610 [Pseudomonadota bacterium]
MKELMLSAVTVLSISFAGIAAHAAGDTAKKSRPSREAEHAAAEACRTENKLALPEPGGEPPTEEQRLAMDACMKKKGFEMRPPHHGLHGPRGHHGPPPPPPPGEKEVDAAE